MSTQPYSTPSGSPRSGASRLFGPTTLVALAVVLVALGLLVVGDLLSTPAAAFPTGQTGHSGNPDQGGTTCATCHTGGEPQPTVTMSGPVEIAAGETGSFLVTISGGPAVVAGFNVSSSGGVGTLAPASGDAQASNGELTHTAPKAFAGGTATFAFTWDASGAQPGTHTLYAAGVSANGATGNQGDSVSAAVLQVDVVDIGQPAATCMNEPVTVFIANGDLPTNGPDVILGTSGADIIAAGDGDDLICAGGGDDRVWGQNGNDRVFGEGGDDKLRGGAGNDTVSGGPGNDDLAGGQGDDNVSGDDGDDPFVRGNGGDDTVSGGAGNDSLVNGNGGEDRVFGNDGDDTLIGGPRPDVLDGGAGADLLRGLNGADELSGGDGDDNLLGGKSPDTMDGGAGTDSCNGGTTGVGSNGVLANENDTAVNCETVTNTP